MRVLKRSTLPALALLAVPVALLSSLPVFVDGYSPDEPGLAERLTRLVSAEMRRDEVRVSELKAALALLPELQPAPFSSRFGFRSNAVPDEQRPHWIQLDLGRRRSIDRLVAVPVHIPSLGERGKGYGFPRRFRIEVGDDEDMQDAKVVVDRTHEDVPNPGLYPVIFNTGPVEGRFVRFTSTRHFRTEEGFIWALEELMVLSGNNNIGVGCKVVSTNSLELFPNWSKTRINDGQSSLGMPVSMEESPTGGYASAVTDQAHASKIVSVDLGAECPIDEIRWLPAESSGFEVPGWHSFPRSSKIELARSPDFTDAMSIAQMSTSSSPGYPGHCALIVQGMGRTARHVRLVTEALWGVEDSHGFALAEVQVYSNGRNIALGKPVTVSDVSDRDAPERWAPSFLVDGFTSRHRLIEYPEYLGLIALREHYEKELGLLTSRRAAKVRTVERTLAYSGIVVGLALLFGGMWMFSREKRLRGEAVRLLREQIARDLHDDIGSNLGGIVLLSDMGSRHSQDEQARQDFRAILEAAEQTSQSMQDIVWLIERGQTGVRDLIARMRRSVATILGEDVASISVTPDDVRDQTLTLFFLRHFFLAFKETLNNVRRHAAASEVRVRVVIDDRWMSFEVTDNGVGFDPEKTPDSGHGLANLRRRAGRLGGECLVESHRNAGTRVVFKAPITPRTT